MTVSLPKFTPTPALPKYRTRFASHNTPTAVAPGETVTVTLSIQNVGSATWPQGGANPVRLGFYWSDAKGQKITLPPQMDFRTPLTRDVPPNTTVVLHAQLRTPDRAGRYQLRWDLIQEGGASFTAQGDAGLLVSPITVNPAAPRVVAPAPAAQPAPVPAVAAAAPMAVPVVAPAAVAASATPVTPIAAPVAAAAPVPAVHVPIQNVIEQLARHPSKQYTTRAVSDIRRIIIHHTATPANVTVDRIAQFLVSNRDLPGITYHFCITAEGIAYQTQPLVVTSVHAGQDSRDSIGVCLIGNFVNTVPPAPQLQAAASVLAQLLGTVNLTPHQILGYNEIASTASPGNTWPTWKPQLLAQVQAFLGGTAAPAVATAAPVPAAPPSARGIPSEPAPTPAAPTPAMPAAAPAVADKPIDHYLLLWHKGPADWAEWSLRAAFDYLERFPVTVGFSIEEAKRAKYVTVLGGPEGLPATTEAALQAAGCRVERINGATETEIRQTLRALARQGKRFQTLQ